MVIILMNRSSFEVIQLNSVTNITYSSGNYVITAGGTTTTKSAADYILQVINS